MLRLLFALSLLCSSILAQVGNATGGLPTISVKGAKLFTSDGEQFYIKGLAYQLDEDDTLVDSAQCERDAALMRTIGTNSIRVYHVETSNDHDGCMTAFGNAGIYVWLDLDTRDDYILPDDSNVPRWTESMYTKYKAVMDQFQGYDNIAGFFIGNEMLTTGADSVAAPFLKAAARDMKAYRDAQGYRDIPIGYSAADIPDLRPNLQNYLACGSNSSENVDFYSLNAYEWCGESSYTTSGYDELEANATGYDIPIFFSETGCNVEPRTFDDQTAIFGPEMDDTWSGAIIYQWVEKANNFGIISYPGGGLTGTPRPIEPDFNNLKQQWARLNPIGVAEAAYRPSFTPPPCPAYTKGMWDVKGDAPLPTLGEFGSTIKESTTVNALKSATASAKTQGGEGGGGGSGGSGSSAATATGSSSGGSLVHSRRFSRDESLRFEALLGFVGVAIAGLAVLL